MIGRVYSWRGQLWRVVCRWSAGGPRNVLLERVVVIGRRTDTEPLYGPPLHPERLVRPFRGLKRA